MKERILDRDPVCIHEVSIYLDCDTCELECSGSNPSDDVAAVLMSTTCPFCKNSLMVMQKPIPNTKEEPATDG